MLNAAGTGLSLSADSAPPPEIVDLLRASKSDVVAYIQAERSRINRWSADRLIDWPQTRCLHCRKPIIASQAWIPVSNGDVTARFHADCEPKRRAEQEALARRALGIDL
jgi:hypothetical protein